MLQAIAVVVIFLLPTTIRSQGVVGTTSVFVAWLLLGLPALSGWKWWSLRRLRADSATLVDSIGRSVCRMTRRS